MKCGSNMAEFNVTTTTTRTSAVAGGFAARLAGAANRANSLLCLGLDPDPARLPTPIRNRPDALLRFNAALIEATADLVCAYKPNLGFYLAHGAPGLAALLAVRQVAPPDIPVILDAKVGDMASTATAYARAYFDAWGFDAITASPYLGEDALAPFLGYRDRGVFVLCKTSNRGSGDLQDLTTSDDSTGAPPRPLYMTVAARARVWAERYPATLGLVVGATYPAHLAAVRAACPALPILLPGIGAQTGDLEASVRAGLDSQGAGLLVAASRAVIYAGDGPDFAARAREAARQLRDGINAVRQSCPMRDPPATETTGPDSALTRVSGTR